MTALLTSYVSSGLHFGDWAGSSKRKKKLFKVTEQQSDTQMREEGTKKWESWRVVLKEMKSDLLVHRLLYLVCSRGNGFTVCVCFWEYNRVCVYLLICICFLVSFCVCLWDQDLANQCCLGLAVRDIHQVFALIISVVIFTKWFRFAVWCVACVCVCGSFAGVFLCFNFFFLSFFLFLINEIPTNSVWTKEAPKTKNSMEIRKKATGEEDGSQTEDTSHWKLDNLKCNSSLRLY